MAEHNLAKVGVTRSNRVDRLVPWYSLFGFPGGMEDTLVLGTRADWLEGSSPSESSRISYRVECILFLFLGGLKYS